MNFISFNLRAKRCYEKCGFQVEGVLKDEIFKEGKYYDEIIIYAFRK
ncbi:GNAT family N-acetyltransferase [Clostridium homopropionicum]|nr:GNAT family protein [Clostridium homopropionicum]